MCAGKKERRRGRRRRRRRREKKAGLMEEAQGRGRLSFSLFFFSTPGADPRIEEWEFREALHERLCLRDLCIASPLCSVDPRM